jgi:LPPG:FO 2-phospho-L-lactate transferase
VVVLAGGTGGAKLARGLLDVVAAGELTVIANTGDDIEIYGAYVSPDPDLVSFWLADRIDKRGWGLEGDTFHVMDGLREIGEEVWFNLGDRDLAIGIRRAKDLDAGERLTESLAKLTSALDIDATVLPMTDLPVRTQVMAQDQWFSLQEFLIRAKGEGPVQDVRFRGAAAAAATPEVLSALSCAKAIIIGPSNPVVSIAPILAVPGVHGAIEQSSAPVVAVSPLIHGKVLKGPTQAFMEWSRQPVTASGIVALYEGLIDGIVCDERVDDMPSLVTDVMMEGPEGRRRLAEEALAFAVALGPRPSLG